MKLKHPHWKGRSKNICVLKKAQGTHTLLKIVFELVKEFGKFAVYKISTQKSVAFLYTGQSEDNILKIPIYFNEIGIN